MKCQKCGKSEVNFHYSSNVNGNITETHLCSQCAEESGYDLRQILSQGQIVEFGQIFDLSSFFDVSQLVDPMFPVRGVSGFVPLAIPRMRSNNMLPFTVHPVTGKMEHDAPRVCGCGNNITKDPNEKVDEEMSLRRELNAQMRAAVEKEEFEKAAELRDMIRELESKSEQGTGRMKTCDSETTTQDLPTAQ